MVVRMQSFPVLLILGVILLNFVDLVESALTFAQPVRGFSSSAQFRSADMHRMYANNPQMTVVGGSAAYRGDLYKTPYHNPPSFGSYLQPVLLPTPTYFNQQQQMGGFGSFYGSAPSLAAVLGIQAPAIGPVQPNPPRSPCPMSPFAQYLSKDQQEALHELIIEARRAGAQEPEVKEYTERFVKELLDPQQFAQFQKANADFERRLTFFKRGKRQVAATETGPSIKGTIPSRFDQVTSKTKKFKKMPQKVQFPDQNALFDFIEVPKDNLNNLVELL